ncbi:MAG: hypothetical protein EXR54_09705 [Dehalococcoidia bacterium]|nr:hypothetical protein [Dehalococcoidia bacterium]
MDDKFRTPENQAIIAFIERENPSAHDDASTLLSDSAKGLPDVRWYCPNLPSYAYMVLYTPGHRIFGIAFGMSAVAFLLPSASIPGAVSSGGQLHPQIGAQWVLWQSNWTVDLRVWCKAAHDYAAGSRHERRCDLP